MSEPNAPGFAPAAGAWTGSPTPPAHVAPGLLARLEPAGWRVTIIVFILMIAGIGGVNLLDAIIPVPAGTVGGTSSGGTSTGPTGPTDPGVAIDVHNGYQVYAPDGWQIVENDSQGLYLGKGSGVIAIQTQAFDGSLSDFEAAYRTVEFAATGAGTAATDPTQGTIGGGVPALVVSYTMATDKGQIDGAYVAGLRGGVGIIVDLVTPSGSIDRYADDLNQLLRTVQFEGGAR